MRASIRATPSLLLLVLLFGACADEPLTPEAEVSDWLAAVGTSDIRDLSAIELGFPRDEPHAWEKSDSALVRAIVMASNRVVIGIKDPTAPSVRETGRRAALTPYAWTVTRGAGASIKVLDTGYKRGHEDLPYIPAGNCSGIKIPCDDSSQELFHGTHVLGIIAALDNSYGVIGVAPDLYDYDIYVSDVCEPEGRTIACYSDYIIEALDQAAGWAVGVVSMSLTIANTTGHQRCGGSGLGGGRSPGGLGWTHG